MRPVQFCRKSVNLVNFEDVLVYKARRDYAQGKERTVELPETDVVLSE
jgi:hypothetical protein